MMKIILINGKIFNINDKNIFCCSCDSNPQHFLPDKYVPLTPNNSGKWNNLIAVTNINDAEWVIIIDDIHFLHIFKYF